MVNIPFAVLTCNAWIWIDSTNVFGGAALERAKLTEGQRQLTIDTVDLTSKTGLHSGKAELFLFGNGLNP